jgi:hypothetical protein
MSVERVTRRSGSRVYRVRWRENGRQFGRTFATSPTPRRGTARSNADSSLARSLCNSSRTGA